MEIKKTHRYILCLILLTIILTLNVFAVPQIKSETFVLMDADTGQVLFERNKDAKIYPASVTKIMTALLALERGNLSDMVTMSHDAVWSVGRNTSHIALDENEQLTLEAALYALAIESANDAANGIAELVGGSMENFAKLMNERAGGLGAKNTNFTNAHGLPDANHYTSAYDLALVMSEAVKIPQFTKIFTATTYSMPPTNRQPEMRVFNRKNSLLEGKYAYEGIIGEKTGWTGDAGFTYIAAARRNGRTLVAAVIKSPNTDARWEDTRSLFDYGFGEFMPFVLKSEAFAAERYDVEFSGGGKTAVKLVPYGDFSCLVPKSAQGEEIKTEYVLYADKAGKLGGKAVFSLKSGEVLGEAELSVHLVSENPVAPMEAATPENESDEPDSNILSSVYGVVSAALQILGIIALVFVALYIWQYMRVKKIKRQKRENQINKNIKNIYKK